MPKIDHKNPLRTRLAEEDMVRFRELAIVNNKTHTELLREAALFYMAHLEQQERDEIESIYAQQLKSSTNRICGLMAKVGIEVHAVIEFLRRMDGGEELVAECLSLASKRISKGLEKEEEKVREQMKKIVSA